MSETSLRSEAIPSDATGPWGVTPFLETVDAMSGGGTGALVFGPRDKPFGMVLVEHGQICWAVATGMEQRLTILLEEQAPDSMPPSSTRDIIRRCARESLPLGETLVESGVVSQSGLRLALRRHTLEALLALQKSPYKEPAWVEHQKHRYEARFTFSPRELLVGIGAMLYDQEATRAEHELAQIVKRGMAASFLRDTGSSMPYPVYELRGDELSIKELFSLGKWAAATADVASPLSGAEGLVSVTTPARKSAVTWASGRLLHVAVCDDPPSLGRLIGAWMQSRET